MTDPLSNVPYLDYSPNTNPVAYPGLGTPVAESTSLTQPGLPDFLHFDSSTDQTRNTRGRRQRPLGDSALPDLIEVPFWDDDPDTWDRIQIGPYQFRGTVHISGQAPQLRIDKRHAPGFDGATIVSKGYELAELKITLRVWTRDQLADFSALIPQIHPKRDTHARNAIGVYHPTLALAQIDRVVFTSPGLLLPASGTPGLYECELSCVEYNPRRNTNATARAQAASARNTFDPAIAEEFDSTLSRDAPSNVAAPSDTNAGP